MGNNKDFSKVIPPHILSPGELIKDELETRDWTQEDFADILGVTVQTVNKLINNKMPISNEMAIKLAAGFGTTPEFWVNLNINYLYLSESSRVVQIEEKSSYYGKLPIAEIRKRGWIAKTGDLIVDIKKFFQQHESLGALMFKKSALKDDNFSQNAALAWFQMAKYLSRYVHIGKYDKNKLAQLAQQITSISNLPNGVENLLERLENCGVKFIVLPRLPKTYVDGATFWDEENPVIVYTTRHDRTDNFYFVVAHEIGHILLHLDDGNRYFIDDEKNEQNQEELEADQFAKTVLQHNLIDKFTISGEYIHERNVLAFAKANQINPTIVAGVLAKQTGKYNTFFAKIRQTVADKIPEKYWAEKQFLARYQQEHW